MLSLLVFMTILIVIKQKTNQVTCLFLNKDNEWELQINNKQRYKVELNGECIVTYFLIWLNFSSRNIWGKEKTHHILLLPDSADKDLLRQLRVRLRFLKNGDEELSSDKFFHHRGHRGTQRD